MKNTDQNDIDLLMDEIQQSMLKNRLESFGSSSRRICSGNDESYVRQAGTTININVAPVINTSSNVTESTKNSPLHELGSIFGSLTGLFK